MWDPAASGNVIHEALSYSSPREVNPRQAFVVIDGPGYQGTRLPIREGITSLGRLPSNDLILLDDLVSRKHARILYFNGQLAVQDMNSHNGCWVNGEKVSKQAVSHRDLLRVGNFFLTFLCESTGEFLSDFASNEVVSQSSDTDVERQLSNVEQADKSESQISTDQIKLPQGVDARHPDESIARLNFSRTPTQSHRLNQAMLLTILRASEALAKCNDLQEYADFIVSLVVETMDVTACGYFENRNDQGPQLIGYSGPALGKTGRLAASKSVLNWVIKKQSTVYSKDISDDIRFEDAEGMISKEDNLRALVCTPVGFGERTLGALYVSRPTEQTFETGEIDVLEAISSLFGAGDQNFCERPGATGFDRTEASARHNLDDTKRRQAFRSQKGVACSIGLLGLSSASEHVSPAAMEQFIREFQRDIGTIVGDGFGFTTRRQAGQINCVFASSNQMAVNAAHAVQTIRLIRRSFQNLKSQRTKLQTLELNVGLSCGKIMLGQLRGDKDNQFTAVGRAVDVAERLRDSGPAGSTILSWDFKEALGSKFETKQMDATPVRTEPDSLERYSLVSKT
ncbi:MAG: FHA domain-containing protein [Myxococcota bacterium]|nr:FHA domain-containing protein [Myxococcota bacterium]